MQQEIDEKTWRKQKTSRWTKTGKTPHNGTYKRTQPHRVKPKVENNQDYNPPSHIDTRSTRLDDRRPKATDARHSRMGELTTVGLRIDRKNGSPRRILRDTVK